MKASLKNYLLVVFLCSFTFTANAQFTTLTNEVLVNTTTLGDQVTYWWSLRTVAVQPDGGFIVVWIDAAANDGQSNGIYGQLFNANGTKRGTEFRVNTTTAGSQYSPSLAVAPDGSFLVAYESPGNSIDIFAQKFTKDGVKEGIEFLLNTTTSGNQRYPEIQYFNDGTFVAGFVDGSKTVIQRFDTDNRTIGQETQISSNTGDVVLDGFCVRPDNSILLFWTSGGDVYGQIFDYNLNAVGSATRLNTYTSGIQQYVLGRVDADGDMVLVWESDGQDGSGNGVYGKRYDKNFNQLGSEFCLTTTTTNNQYGPTVVMAPGGEFITAWTDENNRDAGGSAGGVTGASVWFRLYDINGNPVGSETRINQTTTGYQGYTLMDINASGKFVIVWEGNGTQAGNVDAMGIFCRSYQLTQTGTTAITVSPANVKAGDLVTVTMTLTAPANVNNVTPNPLSISGTNGVFATLVSGPTPASATVGTLGTAFTWTYRVTAEEANGTLTFGGNAHSDGAAIFPYAVSNSAISNTVLFVNDITGPNLVNDANLPTSGPEVFTIGARVTNSGLSPLTNAVVNLGNGTTPGVFPTTTMTLSQTNNTYQGTFSLNPLGGISDCTRPLGTLGAAKAMIAGRIDFNGDGVITTADDGTLSNGQIVIDGLIDVDRNGTVNGSDDYNRPPGLFVGYRDPAIINGFVDSNNDGAISALDNSNYGGETKVMYWQVQYKVEDAFGKPTYGNGSDFNDDLRYRWFIWATATDGLITRSDVVKDFAKVRQMQSAAANKATPSGGYISSSAKVVIDGQVDINGDGAITTTDDGAYYGYNVINGLIDITGDGNITITDDGVVNSFTVINGYVDADPNNIINTSDDGILVAVGNTFTVTFNNATFGTVGEGFDENRDGLSDYDFWFQPIGEPNFPTAFRLVNIVAHITGSGGSNPLNGITNTYVNDPYISRLIGNMSSTFDATYTYTFQVLANANGCLTPYQEAASGTNNVKYNGDYPSCIPVKTYGGNFVLPATGLAANANLNGAHATIDWVTVTELNTSFFEVERSLNGIDFSKIAYVKASGNSTVQHDYTSLDNIAAYTNYPKIFYRIKLISENGSVQYSNITAVTPVNNARVKVWPNPFTDKIILSAKITTSEKVSVRLYDAGGRLTCSKDVYVRPGNQELILNDIKHLQSGIYHLRVAGVSFVETFILRKE